jgi:hypothetical protein
MADQSIEIKLILRDEMSRQLEPIAQALRNLNTIPLERAHMGMQRFGGGVQVVRRELSSLARISLGGLAGAGIVGGIYAVVRALGDMARQGKATHQQLSAP